jgi:hypothetical protein
MPPLRAAMGMDVEEFIRLGSIASSRLRWEFPDRLLTE